MCEEELPPPPQSGGEADWLPLETTASLSHRRDAMESHISARCGGTLDYKELENPSSQSDDRGAFKHAHMKDKGR